MPTGKRLTEAQVTEIRELIGAGITLKAIAKKFGLSESPISRISRNPKITGVSPTDPQAAPSAKSIPVLGHPSKYGHLEPEMMKLKSQGLGVKAVAEKLGVPRTTVNYYYGLGVKAVAEKLGVPRTTANYYYGGKKKYHGKKKATKTIKTIVPGETTSGHKPLDTKFLVGFGCAELARTLAAVAERLGIDAKLLGQGFSEFLGSQTLR